MNRVPTLLAGLSVVALAAVPARAQDNEQELGSSIPEPISIPGATPAPTPAPASGQGGLVAIPPARQGSAGSSVGPDALRDFSLGGPVPQRRAPTPAPAPAPTRTMPTPVPPPSGSGLASPSPTPAPSRLDRTNSPVGSVTPVPPPSSPAVVGSTLPDGAAGSSLPLSPSTSPDGLTAPESGFSNWPWLVALLAVLAGGAFAWQRRRPKRALAGPTATVTERAAAPAPAPAPDPESAPAPTPPVARVSPPVADQVTTRLLPELRIDIEPVRAVFADEGFTLDYRLIITNQGQGIARQPTIRQDFLFASATQDRDIDDFGARPPGSDDKLLPGEIPAGASLRFDARAHMPLEKAQLVLVGDRKLFLPILALAVRHGGQAPAQKPAATGAWIIGRKGGADGKMAPIRADRGARVIRDLQVKRQ